MTAERIKGNLEITCDGSRCTDFVTGRGSFAEVWNEAKSEGWTARSNSGIWFHYCASCSKPSTPNMPKITKGL